MIGHAGREVASKYLGYDALNGLFCRRRIKVARNYGARHAVVGRIVEFRVRYCVVSKQQAEVGLILLRPFAVESRAVGAVRVEK